MYWYVSIYAEKCFWPQYMYLKMSPNNGFRWCLLGKFSHLGLEQLLDPPTTFSELSMLLGMFRFYALWITFFEVWVLPWKSILKQRHREGAGGQSNPISSVYCIITRTSHSWKIKKGVVTGPILACTKFSRRMWLKNTGRPYESHASIGSGKCQTRIIISRRCWA